MHGNTNVKTSLLLIYLSSVKHESCRRSFQTPVIHSIILVLGFPFVPIFPGTVRFLKEILGGPRTLQGSPNVLNFLFGRSFHLHRCNNYNFSLSYTDGERVQILLCLSSCGYCWESDRLAIGNVGSVVKL